MQREVTTPVPPLFRTARLFFSGGVSGGVVATGFAIARDLGVPIRPERLLASLLSPPLPPASRLAAFAVFVAFAGLLAIAYGSAFRGLHRGASPAPASPSPWSTSRGTGEDTRRCGIPTSRPCRTPASSTPRPGPPAGCSSPPRISRSERWSAGWRGRSGPRRRDARAAH